MKKGILEFYITDDSNPVTLARWVGVDQSANDYVGPYSRLPAVLLDDIHFREACSEVLSGIQAVESESLERFCWAGNAWTTTISKDLVLFEHQWIDDIQGGSVTLAQFKIAVTAWCRFMNDKSCSHLLVELSDLPDM